MEKVTVYATYDTYEEAEKNNPECDIFTNTKGVFRAIIDPPTSHFANDWKLAKPTPQPKEVEWVNGDEIPPVGWRGLSAYTEDDCDNWCDFHDGVVMGVNGDYVWMAHYGKFQRVHHIGSIEFKEPESPEDKAKREIEELLVSKINFNNSSLPKTIARILIESNYRCTTSS